MAGVLMFSIFIGRQPSLFRLLSSKHLYMKNIFLVLISIIPALSFAQEGVIKGRIFNPLSNESIPFATVAIQGTSNGAVADMEGIYELNGLVPGLYNLEAASVGFEGRLLTEIQVTNARPAIVDIALKESATRLEEVEVLASPFAKTEESPVSLRTIGVNEIQRAPGGNRDISKVLRSLPGVASTVSFRNDIIIRGGAPGENKFYLDGIETPVINHFQTQGSSGGPVGILNVDLLKEVDFYSGAFPVNRGNALSSVFDFKLRDGRNDKAAFNATLGASDLGVTFDGPLGENASLIVSARRSYLQFLFSALELPFLPAYNDLQFKYKWRPDSKNQLTVLGIGALDDFELNLKANETDLQRYFLNSLPVSGQWNYTLGVRYDHFREKGFSTVVVSQNRLNTSSWKYKDNDESLIENLIQDYSAEETEYKFRIEDFSERGNFNFTYGASYERAEYASANFNKLVTPYGLFIQDYTTELGFNKWGGFAQSSVKTAEGRLVLSGGFRLDANDYSSNMNNLFQQFSPRFSLAWNVSSQLSFNFNTGRYYQLPPYTTLGYRDNQTNELVNKTNDLRYLRADHLVAGLEYNFKHNAISTVEAFYKKYSNYPFLLTDSVSLANMGADFGAIGNSPAASTSEGRAYGVEWMYQQKLFKGVYGILAYTWVRSEFTDGDAEYVPSSWDNRHLVSITGGRKFKKNWELGMRWLFSGGAPYTPWDIAETIRIQNWDIRPFAQPDYSLLNSERGKAYHQLDIRIDKKYFFGRWSLNLYFDVQNAYNSKGELQDYIDVQKDAAGSLVVDPANPEFYVPLFLPNEAGTLIPTLGVVAEF